MKKRDFPLNKVLKYRSYLEKDQASIFRDAMNNETAIESALTSHRVDLKRKNVKKDHLISEGKLDIKKIKSLQEEILFSEIDESVLESELIKASNESESERLEWLKKKSESDAVKKLEEKFTDQVNEEEIREEQKETDEIARLRYLAKRKEE